MNTVTGHAAASLGVSLLLAYITGGRLIDIFFIVMAAGCTGAAAWRITEGVEKSDREVDGNE